MSCFLENGQPVLKSALLGTSTVWQPQAQSLAPWHEELIQLILVECKVLMRTGHFRLSQFHSFHDFTARENKDRDPRTDVERHFTVVSHQVSLNPATRGWVKTVKTVKTEDTWRYHSWGDEQPFTHHLPTIYIPTIYLPFFTQFSSAATSPVDVRTSLRIRSWRGWWGVYENGPGFSPPLRRSRLEFQRVEMVRHNGTKKWWFNNWFI